MRLYPVILGDTLIEIIYRAFKKTNDIILKWDPVYKMFIAKNAEINRRVRGFQFEIETSFSNEFIHSITKALYISV